MLTVTVKLTIADAVGEDLDATGVRPSHRNESAKSGVAKTATPLKSYEKRAVGRIDRRCEYAGVPVSTNLAPPAAKLYVSNQTDNTVSVFDLTKPTAASGGGLNDPHGVTIDANGKLYVANSNNSSVSVFDTAHRNAPLPPITGSGLHGTVDVTVDASGKLYVANDSVSIFDTAHGNAELRPITDNRLSGPYGVAVDASGKLYVANSKIAP